MNFAITSNIWPHDMPAVTRSIYVDSNDHAVTQGLNVLLTPTSLNYYLSY